jgi:hypothetical protein
MANGEKSGQDKPKQYKIRIDKKDYEVSESRMTGRQILALAGKTPPERFALSERLHGGQERTIGLDEYADFSPPGVEKFLTLPLDQTEG